MYKVNVALTLTPTQVQQAITRCESGHALLLRLQGMHVGSQIEPRFSAMELALLLDFLPPDVVDLTEQSDAPAGPRLVTEESVQ